MALKFQIDISMNGINEACSSDEEACFHHDNHIDKDEFYDYSHNQCIRSVFEIHKIHKSFLLEVK